MKCLNGLMQCEPCIPPQCPLAYLGHGTHNEQWPQWLTALTLMYPLVSSPPTTSGDNEKLWRHEQHHNRKDRRRSRQTIREQSIGATKHLLLLVSRVLMDLKCS